MNPFKDTLAIYKRLQVDEGRLQYWVNEVANDIEVAEMRLTCSLPIKEVPCPLEQVDWI